MTNRAAETNTITIPANGFQQIDSAGEFVRCIESTADFKLSVDNGSRIYFTSGISYTMPDLKQYTSIQLYNDSGSDITVTLGYGFGTLGDNRLTASGNLKVTNPSGDKLDVDDALTQAAIAALETAVETKVDELKTLLQNVSDLAAPVHKIGANYDTTTASGTTTLISSGDNPGGGNGVILRTFDTYNANNTLTHTLRINGNIVYQHFTDANRSRNGEPLPLPLKVPAGQTVTIEHQAAGGRTSLTWDLA